MAKGFKKLSSNLRKLGETITANVEKRVRVTALAIDQAVVMATPVDTGRARSNWIAELNGNNGNVIEPYAPGKTGSTGSANTQAAIEQGKTVIGEYKSGDAIHIHNNLPYITRLNDGYSAQAPASFIEGAVAAGVEAGRKVKLTEK